MKKPFMVICAGAMLALLAGCSSNYVMTTKSGQTIVTHGKPQLDKETGMTSYIDESGNKRKLTAAMCRSWLKIIVLTSRFARDGQTGSPASYFLSVGAVL